MMLAVDLVTNVESVSNAWQSKRHPVYKHYEVIDDKYCICLKCKTKLVHGFGPSSLMYHLNTCNKEAHFKVTLHTCITDDYNASERDIDSAFEHIKRLPCFCQLLQCAVRDIDKANMGAAVSFS